MTLHAGPGSYALPASANQQRLWMLDQLDPGCPAYNITWAVHLAGPLDVAVLARSLGWLLARHEALRTVLGAVDGAPVQFIRPPWTVTLEVTDAPPGADPAALAAAEGAHPFDLATGPLVRHRLLRRGPERHVLLLVVHHAVADGWSFDTLFDELAAAYAAGGDPGLPPPPVQYADVALWQRARAAAGDLDDGVRHWRDLLAGAPAVLALPTDRPRPAELSWAGGLARRDLPDGVSTAVDRLARAAGTTPFAVLLAAFQALLHRLSGQDDLLVAVPVSGRLRSETTRVVGFFANTLALRARFGPRPTFRDVLGGTTAAMADALAHQETPFDRVVDAVTSGRSLAHAPLVQVMFATERQQKPRTAGALRIAPELCENGSAKFDLTLTVEERPAGLGLRLTYRRDLFDADRVAALADGYAELLDAALADPDAILPSAGGGAPTGYNDTALALPAADLATMVRDQWPGDPATVAVAGPDGAPLTYGELAERSDRLAGRLRAEGAGPDTPVGLCLPRGAAVVTAILAVWKAGAGYLPLDPSLPVGRLAATAADAGVRVLLADASTRTAAEWPAGVRVLDVDDPATEAPPSGAVSADGLAYLLYTSGSTGTPKGVAVTQRSLVNLLTGVGATLGLGPDDRVAALTTPAFDISVVELVLPLLAGARVEVFDEGTVRDAALLRRELARRGVTVVQATPTNWRMLLAAGGVPAGVRLRISGGEALTRELADALRTGGARLLNGYGPSETTVYSTLGEVGPDGPVDLGRPVANTRLHLLDARMRPVAPGVVGEIHLAGFGVARGYHARAGQTADRFRPDPFGPAPGGRLYATGDLARWLPDGRLEYLGRTDHQVKVRGFRIELGEVEAALRARPELRDAVVTAWRGSAGDSADVRLVAYAEPVDPAGSVGLWPAVREALARTLPEYMIPAMLVPLDRLPRTPGGKIDRQALPEPRWGDGGTTGAAPSDPVQERLAALWCAVLGLPGVGVHDSFFDLGGHSLTATRLIARITAEFGVALPLRSLFAAPTIAGLAERLTEEATTTVPGPAAWAPGGPDPAASLDSLSDDEIDDLLDTLIAEENG
ncbi:non-ribosomal peptide synthetase [Couchioplanes caeruleus]|uniref:Non-ribosomal peptide synthetase n=2 Tax=Couchioplanes caeruleus TaxID=56438 RepID=A0A1K0GTT1_9ACTN|nr:non-ribosomal peptide synthetase [Couchioplanes caeruleus]OJF15886.1 non-ribosomal peptide synthetase [Couchioplanes caeruleus subsp. caeruleus]ROP28453.1 amino acid adenylation domain-containing protein [Couchioplanes caeruleus]